MECFEGHWVLGWQCGGRWRHSNVGQVSRGVSEGVHHIEPPEPQAQLHDGADLVLRRGVHGQCLFVVQSHNLQVLRVQSERRGQVRLRCVNQKPVDASLRGALDQADKLLCRRCSSDATALSRREQLEVLQLRHEFSIGCEGRREVVRREHVSLHALDQPSSELIVRQSVRHLQLEPGQGTRRRR